MAAVSLDEFLSRFSPQVQAMARRARELILEISPGATETVWPGWRSVGYGTGTKMADLVVGVAPLKTEVAIRFLRGSELPDPAGLLREGDAKRMRAAKFRSPEELESPALRALLEKAFAIHGTPPPEGEGENAEGAAAAEPPVGEEAVRAKTGRGWAEWVALLDEAGAAEMDHKAIVAHLAGLGVGPWWRQAVTVGYERLRGKRDKHQTPAGYQAGGSKTVAVPLERLFAAWAGEAERERWLGDGAALTVSRATPNKSMRIAGEDGSRIDVLFVAKGEGRSQVSVDHRKLPDAAAVQRAKAFWKERLGALKEMLEG